MDMNAIPFVAVVVLVLVGLLVGFNIQISSSFVQLISSLGAFVGGLGAAFAAFFSYKSIHQWREQFVLSNVFELLNEQNDIMRSLFTDFNKKLMVSDIDKLTFQEKLKLQNEVFHNVEEQYERLHNRIEPLLGDRQRETYKVLHFNNIKSELFYKWQNIIRLIYRLVLMPKS
ncbi:hypothetical protein V9656_000972 [Vibrio parahaemolyticus]